MITRLATHDDFDAFLSLAREVEPLFGPMVDSPDFLAAVRGAIDAGTLFCAVDETDDSTLSGACVIDREQNEIAWLAVSAASRGRGIGSLLVGEAMAGLDPQQPIRVTTFADSNRESIAAKKLYRKHGFADAQPGEINPAGLPTVVMERKAS